MFMDCTSSENSGKTRKLQSVTYLYSLLSFYSQISSKSFLKPMALVIIINFIIIFTVGIPKQGQAFEVFYEFITLKSTFSTHITLHSGYTCIWKAIFYYCM